MKFETLADLPIQSPILVGVLDSDPASDTEITLADLTGIGLIHLRGAEDEFGAAYGELPGDIGQVLPRSTDLAARMTDDEWVLIGADLTDVLTQVDANPRITITDLTHGYGILLVAGARARAVLTTLCALDFSEPAFPDFHAAQTSLANVRTLIIRRDYADQDAYLIAVGRSVTEYVWNRLMEATSGYARALVAGEPWVQRVIRGSNE
ncbi:MAG: hypothetical protein ACE5JF_11255 [Anaerolineales bacterium]